MNSSNNLETPQNPGSNERASRPSVSALDDILGTSFPVLDNGFVRLVDYMGNDGAIVQAARVSYGVGTKQVQEDHALIRYLFRHAHTTPFEMCEIKLHIRAPMDVWRQWIRHRTANVNEYSTRYSVAIDAAQKTQPHRWRIQSTGNKQGSSGFLPNDVGARLSAEEEQVQRTLREAYERRLEAGVAREQARKDLPLSTYTEAYWKIDLHNLFHFLHLRLDAHAQQEIRAYAETIGSQIVARWVPAAWNAFVDYRRDSVTLSRIELEIVTALNKRNPNAAEEIASSHGLLTRNREGVLKRNREREELERKLTRLGLSIPW